MTAHILVVDDEPDVEVLRRAEFRHKIRDGDLLFARGGVEALAALKANGQIDLVVTDINMPRMEAFWRGLGVRSWQARAPKLRRNVEARLAMHEAELL